MWDPYSHKILTAGKVLSSLRARPRSTKPVSFIERKRMKDEIPSIVPNDIDKHVTHHYAENSTPRFPLHHLMVQYTSLKPLSHIMCI
jgi:hypothetical protein